MVSAEGSAGEGLTSERTWLLVGFKPWLAGGWRLPSALCHVGLSLMTAHNMAAASSKPAREEVRSQGHVIILCNLIIEVLPLPQSMA